MNRLFDPDIIKMTEAEILTAKIKDLDRLASQRNITKSTRFLSLSEQSVLHSLEKELCGKHFLYGGHENCDRAVCIWPADYESEEECREIVRLVKVSPINRRFSDELTHRDFLGALMNLGIERDLTGDILVDENTGYVFCLKEAAGLITGELMSEKHTSVVCVEIPAEDFNLQPKFRELRINVASERLDAVIAAVYKLSRSEAEELIASEKVFAGGISAKSNSARLKEGTRVSVRGKGKFIFDGIENETKKGRLYIRVRQFI